MNKSILPRILVITEDKYLLRKIALGLMDICPVHSCDDGMDYTLKITDGKPSEGFITVGRGKDFDLSLPLSLELYEIKELLPHSDAGISYNEKTRIAKVGGASVKLTELEGSLLELLIGAGGEYVSRQEILQNLWSDGCDSGVVNVYIHYLRNKLESSGEKIILSSRSGGYRIDPRFLGGSNAKTDRD